MVTMDWFWVAGFLLVVAALGSSILWFPAKLTYRRRGKPTEDKLLDFEASTRATVAQLCVGLTGFLVLYLALSNLRLADRQQVDTQFLQGIGLTNARGRANASDSKSEAGGLSPNQGDGDVVGRVGGVYALESVVGRHGTYREPVLHVLAALVRREAPKNGLAGPCRWLDDKGRHRDPYMAGSDHETLAADVDAAMAVIGQLTSDNRTLVHKLDLSQTALCLVYAKKANLRGTDFREADLRGSIFDCAHLDGASLTGTNLRGGHMPGASLTKVVFDPMTDLRGADLSCVDFSEAQVGAANFTEANLSHADLEQTDVNQTQLDVACGTEVKLPAGKRIVPCEAKPESIWKQRFRPACSSSRKEFCP